MADDALSRSLAALLALTEDDPRPSTAAVEDDDFWDLQPADARPAARQADVPSAPGPEPALPDEAQPWAPGPAAGTVDPSAGPVAVPPATDGGLHAPGAEAPWLDDDEEVFDLDAPRRNRERSPSRRSRWKTGAVVLAAAALVALAVGLVTSSGQPAGRSLAGGARPAPATPEVTDLGAPTPPTLAATADQAATTDGAVVPAGTGSDGAPTTDATTDATADVTALAAASTPSGSPAGPSQGQPPSASPSSSGGPVSAPGAPTTPVTAAAPSSPPEASPTPPPVRTTVPATTQPGGSSSPGPPGTVTPAASLSNVVSRCLMPLLHMQPLTCP
ncbi:MAG: hypothetical protein ABR511_03680 [Acidimicrobiales bacterium]